ncbi:hypothetical protein H0H81_001691 [Sphagnurus paluster]|uniref:Uncharacterized protein n=1 Tax=Sphagnurus paluster TaxID=117069 RepID=A0A9P7GM61_9AGAR|nr:hypothetical protein H0H81_001691 [Sphagnurus paluster]
MRVFVSYFVEALVIATCMQYATVFASVYPTQPIARTTFTSGKLALITWRDDWREPLLKHMDNMRIDLYGNNSEFITTLAKNVSPVTRTHSVFIPPGLKTASY